MDVLTKIINQNYDIKLSDENIYNIVSYYYMLTDFFQKTSYIRMITEAMQNKIIDPDVLLAVAISEVETKDDVALVALALRYGANPNLYLVFNGMGVVHLMVYTVMILRENVEMEVLNYLLSVEALLGSSFSSPVYKTTRIRDLNFDNPNTEMVGQFLDSQGYYDFSDPVYFVKNLLIDDQIMIGTLCDMPEIAFPMGFGEEIVTEVFNEDGTIEVASDEVNTATPDLLSLIIYQAFNCARLTPIPMTFDNGENNEIRICLNAGALEILLILFDRGFEFNYFSMNRLLVLLKNTFIVSDGNSVVINRIYNQIYYEILKYVINNGTKVDKDQFAILDTMSISYAGEIANLYSKPLWVKSCSASAEVPLPEMVKTLAYSLNIDTSKDKSSICADLSKAADQSPETLKIAAINRQKNRIAAEVHGPTDYATGRTEIKCKNYSSINGNPFEYNDSSLAHYVDSNRNLWCFVAPDFENLVSNPVNPTTGEPLPGYVISKMRNSLDFFRAVGVSPDRVVPLGEAANFLQKPDTINNANSDKINSNIINIGQLKGIYPAFLKNITTDKIMTVLELVNMQQDYIGSLTHHHQFSTMCRALYIYFKKYPESVDPIFTEIKRFL